jgi:hypothetical protein
LVISPGNNNYFILFFFFFLFWDTDHFVISFLREPVS